MRAAEEEGAREEDPILPHTLVEGDLAVAEEEEAIVAEIINISLHSINRPRESTSRLLTSNRPLAHLPILMIITIRIKTIVRKQTTVVKKRLKTTITKVVIMVPQPADSIQDRQKKPLTTISMREVVELQSMIMKEQHPLTVVQVEEKAIQSHTMGRVSDTMNTQSLKNLRETITNRRNPLNIREAQEIIKIPTAIQVEEVREVVLHEGEEVAIKEAEEAQGIIHLTKIAIPPQTQDHLSMVVAMIMNLINQATMNLAEESRRLAASLSHNLSADRTQQ